MAPSQGPGPSGARVGGRGGPLEVSVDVGQGQAPGQHEHLHPVEQLADLLRRPLGALVLGGHPRLGRLLDDLLARGVHPVPDGGDRARSGIAGGDLLAQLGEELVEGLHAWVTPKPVLCLGVRSSRSTSAVCSDAAVASQPLSSAESARPARSRACCSPSVVRTPLPTGLPASSATRVRPAVTESQTYSKCGVPPRTTTPSATTASWVAARACATTGSSMAPGTRTTVGEATPEASAQAIARLSSDSVISLCHVVATIPRLSPAASTGSWVGAPDPLMRAARSDASGRRSPRRPAGRRSRWWVR